MSIQQVDLMCADTSVTVYPKTDSAKGSNGKERKFNRPSKAAMDDIQKKFENWGDLENATFDLSGFTF